MKRSLAKELKHSIKMKLDKGYKKEQCQRALDFRRKLYNDLDALELPIREQMNWHDRDVYDKYMKQIQKLDDSFDNQGCFEALGMSGGRKSKKIRRKRSSMKRKVQKRKSSKRSKRKVQKRKSSKRSKRKVQKKSHIKK
jgi:hypothetical protein